MNPIYLDAFVSKIICAWSPYSKDKPFDIEHKYSVSEPICTFDECLEVIKSIYNLTGGAKTIFYLVGWQYDGHDDGYPSMDIVNKRLGGREKLLMLIEKAKQYNCTIAFHINIDDAYEGFPGFDEAVNSLCLGTYGKPYVWGYGDDIGRPKVYHISHTKELETGYFYKRMKEFFDTVPVNKTVHLDTFRYSNESFFPQDRIGVNEEIIACNKIIDWFNEQGIDVTNESIHDGFFGRISWAGHLLPGELDPFILIMIHGKIGGDLKGNTTPAGEVLGCQPLSNICPIREGKIYPDGIGKTNIDDLYDAYYLYVLLYQYLRRKELLFIGNEGEDYVARFSDGCISKWENNKVLKTIDGELIIAYDKDRFIPINNHEIRLYSAIGGIRRWKLPKNWIGKNFDIFQIGVNGVIKGPDFELKESYISMVMEPRCPYILKLIE